MTTTKYVPSPVTVNAHLEQLATLRGGEESDRSPFQQTLLDTLLGASALKALRDMHIAEMAAVGLSLEQILLAFTPDAELFLLVSGLETEEEARLLKTEVRKAVKDYKNLDPAGHAELYVKSRQLLLRATQSFLPRVDPMQARPMIELMDRLQQDIAESHGAVFQRAGKRASSKKPVGPKGSAAVEEEVPPEEPQFDPASDKPQWDLSEGRYKQDGDPED